MTLAVLLAGLLTTSATVSDEVFLEETIDGRGALPSLAEVQAAAAEALHLTSADEVETWARRARQRAWLPRFEARFGSDADVAVRASEEGSDWARSGRGLGLDLGASWSLGDLVFSDQELRASRERLARSAAERLARERVTEVYFKRLAVLLEARREPSIELALEGARLDGLLRALTGGRLAADTRRKR
jgi:hypothetical protein